MEIKCKFPSDFVRQRAECRSLKYLCETEYIVNSMRWTLIKPLINCIPVEEFFGREEKNLHLRCEWAMHGATRHNQQDNRWKWNWNLFSLALSPFLLHPILVIFALILLSVCVCVVGIKFYCRCLHFCFSFRFVHLNLHEWRSNGESYKQRYGQHIPNIVTKDYVTLCI